MTANFLRGLLIPIAALSMLSCGGNGGQPLNAGTAATVLSNLNTILAGLPRTNTALSLPVTGATTMNSVKASATDCETVTPTTPVDADSDNIAAEKTATFDCSDFTSGTGTYTRKGTYTVKDGDDTVAGMLGGMSVTFNITDYKFTDTTSGEVSNGAYSGFWKYIGDSSGKLTSTSDFTGRNYFESPTYDFVTDYTYNYTWDWSMTPDSSATPFDSGAQNFSGTYSMSGKFSAEDASGNHYQHDGTWTVKYYSKNLTYKDTGTCTKFYNTGSIFVEDGNGTFEIRYNCTTAELYVNGVKSDWWTP